MDVKNLRKLLTDFPEEGEVYLKTVECDRVKLSMIYRDEEDVVLSE